MEEPALRALEENSAYESFFTKRPISHEEAYEVARRLTNSHFRREPCARVSIPARPDYDDDLLLIAYIKQQERKDLQASETSGSPLIPPEAQ
jgi:hypothetical protein